MNKLVLIALMVTRVTFAQDKTTGVDQEVVDILTELNEALGQEFYVTSGYRSHEHNAKVGGVKNSSHTTGKALDIAHYGMVKQIVSFLKNKGVKRIGIYKTHIHFDLDDTKNPAIWDKRK